jgi:hypothetical protein
MLFLLGAISGLRVRGRLSVGAVALEMDFLPIAYLVEATIECLLLPADGEAAFHQGPLQS